jgi:hypothetical protein
MNIEVRTRIKEGSGEPVEFIVVEFSNGSKVEIHEAMDNYHYVDFINSDSEVVSTSKTFLE